MTAPFSGFKYSAGSGFADLAKAAAAMATGRREEEERKRKAALEEALQRLRERQADQDDRRITLDTDKFGFDREKEGTRKLERVDDEADEDRTFGASEADKTRDDDRANRELTEAERHNRATEAAARSRIEKVGQTSNGREWIVKESVTGKVFRVNKLTGEYHPIEDPGTGQPVLGLGARPTESERAANMLLTSIEPSIDRVEKMYQPGVKAPGVLTQGLSEQAKKGGLLGGIANKALSGEGALGNVAEALGASDPNYQSILTDLTKIYRAYVYVTTGKQLNESEAQDAARQYVIQAGEPEALIAKKVKDMQQMAQAVREASTRAKRFVGLQNEGGGVDIHGSGNATPQKTPAQEDWDRLAAKYGEDETTKQIGPRP